MNCIGFILFFKKENETFYVVDDIIYCISQQNKLDK